MRLVGYRQLSAVQGILVALFVLASIVVVLLAIFLSSVVGAPQSVAAPDTAVPVTVSQSQGLNDQDALGQI
jgi:hypothetical protein